MNKYEIVETLGVGSFGTVYKAKNILSKQLVAIKKFTKKYHSLEKCKEMREIKALNKLNHDNIIKLYETILEENTLYLVFELMSKNLYELINASLDQYNSLSKGLNESNALNKINITISENTVKYITKQILEGLSYMHKLGYFHRDLKPENILIDEQSNIIKLADFGLAREIRSIPPYTQYVSTRWYRAPECLLESTYYSSPIDIWAIGCIVYELLSGKPLFPGINQRDTLMKINILLGVPNKGSDIDKLAKRIDYKFIINSNNNNTEIEKNLSKLISTEAVDFIISILKWDPNERPTASVLLKHSFFNNIDLLEAKKNYNKLVDEFNLNSNRIKINNDKDSKIYVNKKLVNNEFDIDKLLNNSQDLKLCK